VSGDAIRIVRVQIPPLQTPEVFQITCSNTDLLNPGGRNKIATRKRLTQLRLDALVNRSFGAREAKRGSTQCSILTDFLVLTQHCKLLCLDFVMALI
jgi:hypothetical protein